MSVKAVYVLNLDSPLLNISSAQTETYKGLLHVFGLGPFSFEEGLGALMAMGFQPRESAKFALDNLATKRLVIISE